MFFAGALFGMVQKEPVSGVSPLRKDEPPRLSAELGGFLPRQAGSSRVGRPPAKRRREERWLVVSEASCALFTLFWGRVPLLK